MTLQLLLHQVLLLCAAMSVTGSNSGPIRLRLTVRETDGDPTAPPSSAHLPINLDNLPKRLADVGQLPDWPRIVYGLLTVQPQLAARSLSLDRSAGLLRLVSPLRREYLCPSFIASLNCSQSDPADSCRISAVVRIQNLDSEADFLIAELLIDVLDVENSPPQFERTVLPDEEIWENIPVGHVIPLPRAVDADRSGYATCRLVYSLVRCSPEDPPPDNTFSLFRDLSFNAAGPPEYKLRLDRELDRESASRYRYCIAASSDQDQRGRTATVTLVIRVRDHNDNAPVWSYGQLFTVNVSEVNPPGLLLKMSATDADSEFGQVHYRLLRDDSLFAINSIGEITLRHTNGLDYETARQHLLVVAAIDNGKPALSVTATVTINVVDANDNRPRINLEHQFKSVVENNAVPLYIHTLGVSDRDPGANGAVTCQVGPVELVGERRSR